MRSEISLNHMVWSITSFWSNYFHLQSPINRIQTAVNFLQLELVGLSSHLGRDQSAASWLLWVTAQDDILQRKQLPRENQAGWALKIPRSQMTGQLVFHGLAWPKGDTSQDLSEMTERLPRLRWNRPNQCVHSLHLPLSLNTGFHLLRLLWQILLLTIRREHK